MAAEHGYRVLSARPAQAESQVSYAGLADLLDTVLERTLNELPPPQRRALEIALVLRDPESGVPDPPLSPTREGFGMELLRRVIPYEMSAETAIEFRPDGLRFTLSLPAAGNIRSL